MPPDPRTSPDGSPRLRRGPSEQRLRRPRCRELCERPPLLGSRVTPLR
ncbi:MAG: hypothetical protein HY401_03720 [Elusimicrobia bacterium]|nr:hypothetical protein [Elusimicrobiota bacterium]